MSAVVSNLEPRPHGNLMGRVQLGCGVGGAKLEGWFTYIGSTMETRCICLHEDKDKEDSLPHLLYCTYHVSSTGLYLSTCKCHLSITWRVYHWGPLDRTAQTKSEPRAHLGHLTQSDN